MIKAIAILTAALLSLPALANQMEPVDLSQLNMFSLLLLPGKVTALVGLANPQTRRANFATCDVYGSTVSNCKADRTLEFDFTAYTMFRIEKALLENLTLPQTSAAAIGWRVGVLTAIGLNAPKIALHLALDEPKEIPKLTPSAITAYSRLFNTDLNSPKFVAFNSGVGSITAERFMEALAQAILSL